MFSSGLVKGCNDFHLFYIGKCLRIPTRLAGARTGYVGLAPTKTPWCSTFAAYWQGHGNAFAHIRGPTNAGRPMAASSRGRCSPPHSPAQVRRTRNTRHAPLHGLQLHLRIGPPRVRYAEAMEPGKSNA
ncbi:unnamed protein product [Parnassius mnemosyne]|uniref:Uncharacterized protein n=1 Tax=Parnassius mnemosyne TaxID=213953 RepID=A0AAV1LBW8_9NEOP